MHAAGRRTLPPVPRPNVEPDSEPDVERTMHLTPLDEPAEPDIDIGIDDFDTARFHSLEPTAAGPAQVPVSVLVPGLVESGDPAQQFVSRLRTAAGDFAMAAGAESAVVREAVPPARHRRSRCRVVLRYPDGAEADLTFVGSVGRPGTPAWRDFDLHIQEWLGTGQQREAAWLVSDPDSPDGVAVDVAAWVAAS
jgi:hypothetical protein